jgi:hypothetical protein
MIFLECTLKEAVRDVACADCRQLLSGISQLLPDEFATFYIVDILSSESFCGAADVSPDRPDEMSCRNFVQVSVLSIF